MLALLALVAAAQTWTLAMQQCSGGSDFTLHGLWPEDVDSSQCAQTPFDPSGVSSLESEMEKDWLSCPGFHSDNNEFWSHEWSTHGVCSGMAETDFFTTGLALRAKYVSLCSSGEQCRLRCTGPATSITCSAPDTVVV